jgi:hypothetical protein
MHLGKVDLKTAKRLLKEHGQSLRKALEGRHGGRRLPPCGVGRRGNMAADNGRRATQRKAPW